MDPILLQLLQQLVGAFSASGSGQPFFSAMGNMFSPGDPSKSDNIRSQERLTEAVEELTKGIRQASTSGAGLLPVQYQQELKFREQLLGRVVPGYQAGQGLTSKELMERYSASEAQGFSPAALLQMLNLSRQYNLGPSGAMINTTQDPRNIDAIVKQQLDAFMGTPGSGGGIVGAFRAGWGALGTEDPSTILRYIQSTRLGENAMGLRGTPAAVEKQFYEIRAIAEQMNLAPSVVAGALQKTMAHMDQGMGRRISPFTGLPDNYSGSTDMAFNLQRQLAAMFAGNASEYGGYDQMGEAMSTMAGLGASWLSSPTGRADRAFRYMSEQQPDKYGEQYKIYQAALLSGDVEQAGRIFDANFSGAIGRRLKEAAPNLKLSKEGEMADISFGARAQDAELDATYRRQQDIVRLEGVETFADKLGIGYDPEDIDSAKFSKLKTGLRGKLTDVEMNNLEEEFKQRGLSGVLTLLSPEDKTYAEEAMLQGEIEFREKLVGSVDDDTLKYISIQQAMEHTGEGIDTEDYKNLQSAVSKGDWSQVKAIGARMKPSNLVAGHAKRFEKELNLARSGLSPEVQNELALQAALTEHNITGKDRENLIKFIGTTVSLTPEQLEEKIQTYKTLEEMHYDALEDTFFGFKFEDEKTGVKFKSIVDAVVKTGVTGVAGLLGGKPGEVGLGSVAGAFNPEELAMMSPEAQEQIIKDVSDRGLNDLSLITEHLKTGDIGSLTVSEGIPESLRNTILDVKTQVSSKKLTEEEGKKEIMKGVLSAAAGFTIAQSPVGIAAMQEAIKEGKDLAGVSVAQYEEKEKNPVVDAIVELGKQIGAGLKTTFEGITKDLSEGITKGVTSAADVIARDFANIEVSGSLDLLDGKLDAFFYFPQKVARMQRERAQNKKP